MRSLSTLTKTALLVACTQGALAAQVPVVTTLGTSPEGRPIQSLRWNADAGAPIFVFGGIHGDERSAGVVAARLVEAWRSDPTRLGGAHVILIETVNPDGWAANTRKNAAGVDLNRNFQFGWEAQPRSSATYGGASALSETEAKILYDLVEREGPTAILALHSCRTCGGVNNYDGPAQAEAEAMTAVNGYRATPEWDAKTPGSFGTYAGKTRKIATITLEIPREGQGAADVERNVRAIEAFIRTAWINR